MQQRFIFGGDTGLEYEDIKRRQAVADAMLAQATGGAPRNAGEGMAALAQAFFGRRAADKADKDMAAGRSRARQAFEEVFAANRAPQRSPEPSKIETAPLPAPAPKNAVYDAIMKQESGGDPNAVSPAGATGLMQIMPATARDPGYGVPNIFDTARSMGVEVEGEGDAVLQALLKNPNVNRAFGENYFDAMLKANGGDQRLALASYNAGPGAVAKYGDVPPFEETQNYVRSIEADLAQGAPAPAPSRTAPQREAAAPDRPSLDQLASLAADPFLDAGAKAVAMAMLQQEIKEADPLADLRRRKLEAEIVNLERPVRPDDPIAAMRARAQAAGLKEGTPEYSDFMRTGGRTPDKRIIYGEDGKPIYAEGVDPSSIKLTEQQSKDLVYVQRAQGAAPLLDRFESALTNWDEDLAAKFGSIGNYYKSDEYQQAEQAAREWLAAILRKDTGAAITNQEFAIYGPMYLPQPGDGDEVIKQKREARSRAVKAIESGLGSAQIILDEQLRRAGADKPGGAAPAGDAPEGVGPELWEVMTPEERSLWLN